MESDFRFRLILVGTTALIVVAVISLVLLTR